MVLPLPTPPTHLHPTPRPGSCPRGVPSASWRVVNLCVATRDQQNSLRLAPTRWLWYKVWLRLATGDRKQLRELQSPSVCGQLACCLFTGGPGRSYNLSIIPVRKYLHSFYLVRLIFFKTWIHIVCSILCVCRWSTLVRPRSTFPLYLGGKCGPKSGDKIVTGYCGYCPTELFSKMFRPWQQHP